jgi:ribonuclease P protein component
MFATKDKIQHLGRLQKRSDFLRVQQAGKKWVSQAVVVQLAENDGLGRRFGVTATKKLHKKAVDRNRVKRRLRAVACDILPDHLPDHHDIVLIGRVGTKDKPYADLCKDLRWCLKRLTADGA